MADTKIYSAAAIEHAMSRFAHGPALVSWREYLDTFWSGQLRADQVPTFFLHSWDHEYHNVSADKFEREQKLFQALLDQASA